MKKSILLIATLIPALFVRLDAAVDGPNDIMLLGVSDYTTQKNFTFVNFTPIGVNEEVEFTTGIWNGTNFDAGSTYTYQNTTGSEIDIGTVIEAPANALSSLEFLASDQIFAFVGSSATPDPVFGFQNVAWGTSGASGVPTDLADGVSALDLSFGGTNDNAEYIGSRTFTSVAAAQTAIMDESKWIAGNDALSFNTTAIVVPEAGSVMMVALTGLAALVVRCLRRRT